MQSLCLCFIEPQLLPTECLHWGNRDFQPLLLLWPWPVDLHIRIWTSYVKAFESYRLTDIHRDRQTRPKLYITPLCGWSVICQPIPLFQSCKTNWKPTKLCGSSLHGGGCTFSHVFFLLVFYKIDFCWLWKQIFHSRSRDTSNLKMVRYADAYVYKVLMMRKYLAKKNTDISQKTSWHDIKPWRHVFVW